jgi:HEAT repeat protein
VQRDGVMADIIPRHFYFALISMSVLAMAGCGPPKPKYPQSLNSERPDERLAAIHRAADTHDRSVIGILVDRLDDEDEGVRFYAILALERLTGQRLGYRYQDKPSQRWRAIERWRQYLKDGVPTTGEAESGLPSPTGH